MSEKRIKAIVKDKIRHNPLTKLLLGVGTTVTLGTGIHANLPLTDSPETLDEIASKTLILEELPQDESQYPTFDIPNFQTNIDNLGNDFEFYQSPNFRKNMGSLVSNTELLIEYINFMDGNGHAPNDIPKSMHNDPEMIIPALESSITRAIEYIHSDIKESIPKTVEYKQTESLLAAYIAGIGSLALGIGAYNNRKKRRNLFQNKLERHQGVGRHADLFLHIWEEYMGPHPENQDSSNDTKYSSVRLIKDAVSILINHPQIHHHVLKEFKSDLKSVIYFPASHLKTKCSNAKNVHLGLTDNHSASEIYAVPAVEYSK